MNRIDAKLAALESAGRKALVPFVTAGDPSLQATVPVMHALVAAGAGVIEVGVAYDTDLEAAIAAVRDASSKASVGDPVSVSVITRTGLPVAATAATAPCRALGASPPLSRDTSEVPSATAIRRNGISRLAASSMAQTAARIADRDPSIPTTMAGAVNGPGCSGIRASSCTA